MNKFVYFQFSFSDFQTVNYPYPRRDLHAYIVSRLVKSSLRINKNGAETQLAVVGKEMPFRYVTAQLSSYFTK
jgi:hypothetical protein